ncbi:putative phosphate permease CPn_0680/CP_0067/CPj0680/CpB0707 isoform X2 [Apostichopus japonicus]|uniref:putative phosphate permease CPn_0680/CP_0067/CPj0680/CpB0707 isoform X2 n=1 Tax=Stichopus japonicus TaxID=307972 RepID=UPI003AB45531
MATVATVNFGLDINLVIIVSAFMISFMLAAAVGSNSVANIFGTAVGSKALTHTQAFVIAAIFVSIGAVVLGPSIVLTLSSDIVDISLYDADPQLLVLGQIAVMAALAWAASPFLSGILAIVFYNVILYTVLRRNSPYKAMVMSLPAWYFLAIFFNLLMASVLNKAWFDLVGISWYSALVCSLFIAMVIALFVRLVIIPRSYPGSKNNAAEMASLVQLNDAPKSDESTKSKDRGFQKEEVNEADDEDVEGVFKPLLIMVVVLSSFAYGSIIVSISVEPLITIWNVYQEADGQANIEVPFWMFLFGSIGVSFGYVVGGREVTKTMGERLTPIVPSSAFPMELGATTIILLGSNLGLPISSTQCKVGAIAAVGLFDNISAVDYRIMRDTLLAWIVTLPVSGVLAAGITALLVLFEPLL